MLEWLSIAFVVIASLAVIKWAPPPGNWALGGFSLFTCVVAAHSLLKGNPGRAMALAALGFLVVGLVPVYDWAIRPVVVWSPFWTKYGLLALAFAFLVVAPLLGALASKMLLSSAWRTLGVIITVAPAALGVLGGIAYWLIFIVAGPASRGSADQQRLVAIVVVPGLFAMGVWMGVAWHRILLGLVDLS